MKKPVCVVVGVGPGNGAAIARKFSAEGYQVALCARNEQRLKEIAADIKDSRVYCYNVQDPEAPQQVFKQIRHELGPVDTLVYNAGAGGFVNIEDATLESFQVAWEINTRGLFLAAQEALPDMRSAQSGNIVVIGATASIKGGPNSAPFASAKAAQRGLSQSMAKHLGPKKIHVSYVILDGIVKPGQTRQGMPGGSDENFMDPAQIADSVHFLTQQSPKAWTFELDLRTFGEKW